MNRATRSDGGAAMRRTTISGLVALGMLLSACGAAPDDDATQVAAIDNALTAIAGNTTDTAGDPALTAALRDQIMVDPALVQQANQDNVRPPTTPVTGAVPPDGIGAAAMKQNAALMAATTAGGPLKSAPAATRHCRQCAIARKALTLGSLAGLQGGGAGRCASSVSYSAAWANRLPAAVPLYPDARVGEAAGADGAGCALRIVSFSSMAPMQTLLDWYYTRTSAAGYRAEHQTDGAEHVLAGTKADGGAFLASLRTRADGGTDVDLMADGG